MNRLSLNNEISSLMLNQLDGNAQKTRNVSELVAEKKQTKSCLCSILRRRRKPLTILKLADAIIQG